jgi:phosphoglycerate dehydrogenase-like enzyme
MPTVLVTSAVLQDVFGEYSDILQHAGFSIRFSGASGDQMTPQELSQLLKGVCATVAGSEPYTREVLTGSPELRVIARTGVGYDAVDVPAATDCGIAVAVTPGTNHESAAEQAMALLLGVAKEVAVNHQEVASGGYRRRITQPVRGRTLGIVGLGRIGKAVAVRALAFGMKVLAFDPALPAGAAVPPGVQLADWREVLTQSDCLSLHSPLIPATRRLICKETIDQMKDGVWIINTARGGLIDEAALAAALASGKVGAAGLDVTELEPPVGSPLLNAPNVLFSPHLAGIDAEAILQMAVMSARTIVELSTGGWPAERLVNAGDLRAKWRW